MTSRRVVVTGLGATSPVGGDVPSTWQALIAGRSGIRHLEGEVLELVRDTLGSSAALDRHVFDADVLDRRA